VFFTAFLPSVQNAGSFSQYKSVRYIDLFSKRGRRLEEQAVFFTTR
jgi:hypothetical protein